MRHIDVFILSSIGLALAVPAGTAAGATWSAAPDTRFDPAASHATGGVVTFSSRVFDDVVGMLLSEQRSAAQPGASLADAFDDGRPVLGASPSALQPLALGGPGLDAEVTRPLGRSLGESIDAPPVESILAIEERRLIEANGATDFRMRTSGGDLRGAVVPLPAGGWLGVGGLSLLAIARRRRG